jgi:hypothetical protein
MALPKKSAAPTGFRDARVVIVSSIFVVLLAATLLIGGHAAIDPLFQSADDDSRDARSSGDVVYTMPDGVFCRHVVYDNVTGEQTGGSIQRCETDILRGRERSNRQFSWRTNN